MEARWSPAFREMLWKNNPSFRVAPEMDWLRHTIRGVSVELDFSHCKPFGKSSTGFSLSTNVFPLHSESLLSWCYFSHLHHHHLWRTPHCHLLNGIFSSQQFDFGALFSWGMGRKRMGDCCVLVLVACWKKWPERKNKGNARESFV